jgi:hypothetical protein
MASLYEIDQSILACIDQETGELIDPERLESLFMERNQKIENVALWIKNLQSDALAFKAEKEAFAEREKAATKKAEQLKEWLAQVLDGQKFSTGRCAVSFRRSEKVEVLDEDSIPRAYMVETVSYKPDKQLIKEVLKDGQNINGCRLVENLNTQIR